MATIVSHQCTSTIHLFRSTLKARKCDDPIEVISGLTFLHSSMIAASIDKITLSVEEAGVLRSLFIQALHGGAPESVRDKSISYLSQFLMAGSLLDRSWTVECTGSDVGQFAVLISSALGVELYLLFNEATTFTSKSESSEDIASSRRTRCLFMLEQCFRLKDALLSFLIPFQEEQKAAWEILPSRSILQIRQNMHNCVNETLDFITTMSIYMAEPFDGSSDVCNINKRLLSIVERAVMTVGLWIAEDSDLHESLIAHLQSLVNSSRACTLSAIITATNTVGRSRIAQIALDDARKLETNLNAAKLPAAEEALWSILSSADIPPTCDEAEHDTATIDMFGDALQLLLPSLLALDFESEAVVDAVMGKKSLLAGLLLILVSLLGRRCEVCELNAPLQHTLDMTIELLSILLANKQSQLYLLGVNGGEGARALESVSGVSVPSVLLTELLMRLKMLKHPVEPKILQLQYLLAAFVR